ncbi:actin-like protein 9 [Phodopus roborovskii]|uniref:LOC101835135 protein n=1 Tax=Phodopus roborovskii TaxID=109678 RepID=A0AAV0A8T9_PHORO|nr:actin-like protein 9 [Phodopus roborovskii]CAH7411741.1 LOC101835135 [Phodopus roborovskii]
MDINGPKRWEPHKSLDPNPRSSPGHKNLQQEPCGMVGNKLPTKMCAVVIDMGSGTCKMGFAGQTRPTYVVTNIVGCQPKKQTTMGQPKMETYIGEAAHACPELTLMQPVHNGIVVDWEAAELICHHILENDLRVVTQDHPLLFTDPPFSPASNREKLVELAFESLHSPAIYVASQSVLSVYANGRVNGLVVDTGHGVSYTVPVFQGYNLPNGIQRLDLAGHHLTTFLAEKILRSNLPLKKEDIDTMESIKHHYCYVASDFQKEQDRPDSKLRRCLKLPDGQMITVGKELFQCPELLFHPPETSGPSSLGLPGMVEHSLCAVPQELRADMEQNVLLCGGSSLFTGFEGRFRAELLQCLSPDARVVVMAQPNRNFSVWIGGSILASLCAFQSRWIQREQYEEHGPDIVHNKCS